MNFKTKTAAAGILAVLTVAAAAFVILPRHKKLPAPRPFRRIRYWSKKPKENCICKKTDRT